MRSEHAANLAMRSSKAFYRQLDDCYRIGHPIASRTLWQRLMARITNWL